MGLTNNEYLNKKTELVRRKTIDLNNFRPNNLDNDENFNKID